MTQPVYTLTVTDSRGRRWAFVGVTIERLKDSLDACFADPSAQIFVIAKSGEQQ